MTTTLVAVVWSAIALGAVGATVVLAKNCADQPAKVDDDARPALQATSACAGGVGTLGVLHAYLDGAEIPPDPISPEPAIDDAMRTRGAVLYGEYCLRCHGAHGEGNGPVASQLVHAPANFTTGTYELRTTEHESLPTDLDMFRTITRGVHGTAMPPWFALPERDRWAVAAHVRTLSTQFAEDVAPPPVDIRNPPDVTARRIDRGRQIYVTAGCASCHGLYGRGDGPAAAGLTYRGGAPARPRDLMLGRFHRSTRLEEVYLTVVTGLDGTPMASFAKVLPPVDLWDVSMYVHSLTPAMTALPTGLQCPLPIAKEIRCPGLQDASGCPEPVINHDELIGIRNLMVSIHPTN